MQIVAKTGFDILNVKSGLLGKNVKKYFKMSSAEKNKKKNKQKKKKKKKKNKKTKKKQYQECFLAFSIYIYNEKPSFFKMSFFNTIQV